MLNDKTKKPNVKKTTSLLNINILASAIYTRAFCGRMSTGIVLFISFVLMPSLANADEQDTVNFLAGITRTLDDNFLRKPSSQGPASETITTKNVAIKIDKQYSLQRLKFDYNLTSYSYQNHSPLNFIGKNYKAEWQWALTPRLTGSLSTEKTESQYGFMDATYNSKPAIASSETYNFLADWAPRGGLHFLGGATHVLYLNSSNFQPDRGNTVDSIDLGLKYAFSSGSAVTLMEHRRQGEYSNLGSAFPNAFTENESEAKIDWNLTAKSILNMRGAYVQRSHKNTNGVNFSARDYDGLIGSANFAWTPTAKLRFGLSASTDIASFQTNDANYVRNSIVSFTPQYAFTEKVVVRGNLSVFERALEGGVSNRSDVIKTAGVSIDWTPRRYVDIGANLQKSSRSSTESGLDFKDLSTGLSANINF